MGVIVVACYVSVVLMMVAAQVEVIVVACYVSVAVVVLVMVAAQVAMPCHSLLLSNNS